MHFVFYVLIAVGLFYFVRRYEKYAERQEALTNRLRWLEARAELLTQFVCESSALREDAKKFSARGFHSGHDIILKNLKACVCTDVKGRMNSIVDRNEFYTLQEEKNPADFIDGHHLHHEYEDKKHAKAHQQTILPYLQKLNRIAPKAVTDKHLKWLMRDGLYEFQIARFLAWLLPSLSDGFSEISDPEGKKILSELEYRLGGNPGALCRAIIFPIKPAKAE